LLGYTFRPFSTLIQLLKQKGAPGTLRVVEKKVGSYLGDG